VKHILKQIFYLVAISALTALTQEPLSVRKLHESGDTLDISIIQELDHASYNGTAWLKSRQNEDGSFGDNDTLKCTALSILVLSGDQSKENAEISSKAVKWLTLELKNKATTNIEVAAWCCAAIAVGLTDDKISIPQCATMEFLIQNSPETKGNATQLCNEILLSIAPNADTLKLKRKMVNETNYYYNKISLDEMWLNARSINNSEGQLLNKSGKRIDWRGKYAEKLIGTQKIDSKGGGYWEGSTVDKNVYNTALAIIISKEL